eukprot:TRINITY_DN2295_c0_g1_i5.p1 TRINITY_DN2295_c0_g1~~TRINITY_DN2295_c0_g1_i5.p1  ORF type:complete len:305 (-),score=116.04 TRINITY_DN2295_c0_g1_i5:23-937(-)
MASDLARLYVKINETEEQNNIIYYRIVWYFDGEEEKSNCFRYSQLRTLNKTVKKKLSDTYSLASFPSRKVNKLTIDQFKKRKTLLEAWINSLARNKQLLESNEVCSFFSIDFKQLFNRPKIKNNNNNNNSLLIPNTISQPNSNQMQIANQLNPTQMQITNQPNSTQMQIANQLNPTQMQISNQPNPLSSIYSQPFSTPNYNAQLPNFQQSNFNYNFQSQNVSPFPHAKKVTGTQFSPQFYYQSNNHNHNHNHNLMFSGNYSHSTQFYTNNQYPHPGLAPPSPLPLPNRNNILEFNRIANSNIHY